MWATLPRGSRFRRRQSSKGRLSMPSRRGPHESRLTTQQPTSTRLRYRNLAKQGRSATLARGRWTEASSKAPQSPTLGKSRGDMAGQLANTLQRDRSKSRLNKKNPARLLERGLKRFRRRPTLPQRSLCSTIGPGGLNFRVRDGIGWGPSGKATGNRKTVLAMPLLAVPSNVGSSCAESSLREV